MYPPLLARFAVIWPLFGWAGPGLPTGAAHAAALVVFKLSATSYAAGEVGQATLIPESGSTRIALNFSGVPRNTTQPVHVYTYIYEGRCGGFTVHRSRPFRRAQPASQGPADPRSELRLPGHDDPEGSDLRAPGHSIRDEAPGDLDAL